MCLKIGETPKKEMQKMDDGDDVKKEFYTEEIAKLIAETKDLNLLDLIYGLLLYEQSKK